MRRFSSGRRQCRIRPDQDNLPVFSASLKNRKVYWLMSYLQRRFSPSEITEKPSLHLSVHFEPNILCSDRERLVFFNLQDHFPFWTTSPSFMINRSLLIYMLSWVTKASHFWVSVFTGTCGSSHKSVGFSVGSGTHSIGSFDHEHCWRLALSGIN